MEDKNKYIESLAFRVADLEATVRQLSARLEAMERLLAAVSASGGNGAACPAGMNGLKDADANGLKDADAQPSAVSRETLSDTASALASPAVQVYYLSAPSPEGIFDDCSEEEQSGQSLYRMTTTDGRNGTFTFLDSREALVTATISVSQFIKPACKIMGRASQMPHRISTVEAGTVTRDGQSWKVVRKAIVAFEH